MNDQEIYERCVKRLISNRVYDPYAAIVHLEKEIDYYREKIVRLQEQLNGSNPQIIKCGDCKYANFYITADGEVRSFCHLLNQNNLRVNFFCGRAERKENG